MFYESFFFRADQFPFPRLIVHSPGCGSNDLGKCCFAFDTRLRAHSLILYFPLDISPVVFKKLAPLDDGVAKIKWHVCTTPFPYPIVHSFDDVVIYFSQIVHAQGLEAVDAYSTRHLHHHHHALPILLDIISHHHLFRLLLHPHRHPFLYRIFSLISHLSPLVSFTGDIFACPLITVPVSSFTQSLKNRPSSSSLHFSPPGFFVA